MSVKRLLGNCVHNDWIIVKPCSPNTIPDVRPASVFYLIIMASLFSLLLRYLHTVSGRLAKMVDDISIIQHSTNAGYLLV